MTRAVEYGYAGFTYVMTMEGHVITATPLPDQMPSASSARNRVAATIAYIKDYAPHSGGEAYRAGWPCLSPTKAVRSDKWRHEWHRAKKLAEGK